MGLSEIEPIAISGAGLSSLPLRRPLGVEAFGINAYSSVAAGGHVVEDHTEASLRHEEVYAVLAGHAMFTLDGKTLDAPSGTVVFIRDPDMKCSAVAVEAGTSVLAIGGKAGEAHTSPWEWFFYAERFGPTEDWDGAITHLQAGVERHPSNASMLYSLACFEVLGRKQDEALTHLRQAIDLEPRHVEWAAKDDDLASIRGLPGYPTA